MSMRRCLRTWLLRLAATLTPNSYEEYRKDIMTNTDETHDLRPGDPLPQNAIIYIENRSASTKKFRLGDRTLRLTGPGTPTSVQPVDPDFLRAPGLTAMWQDGRIRVTTDPALASFAASENSYRASLEADRMRRLTEQVESVDAADQQPGVVGQDVSDRYHDVVDIPGRRPDHEAAATGTEGVTVVGHDESDLL